MMKKLLLFVVLSVVSGVMAQPPGVPPVRGDGPPFFNPDDGRPRFGPGGGPPQEEMKLVEKFDKNADNRLNSDERKAAREFIQKERAESGGRRGPGGRGPRAEENQEPPQHGAKVAPVDVKPFPDVPLYDPTVVRTLFLDFENADWEKELADFNNTDVEVPATLTVDGKVYKEVGVHFRGASSFFTVGEGRKRSLNVSLDFANKKQVIGGYRTLNLLNAHVDPSFLRTVLYYQIAREYIPTPKANFVRVVINGEDWGVYVNAQQFNKDLIQDTFKTTKGARWKVPGSPRGQGSLAYLGDDPEKYKRIYQIKSKDEPKSWEALIQLCKVLNETPSNKLEAALAPLLDVDGTLKFLALENALSNNDGYWVRTSDYNLYRDEQGRFHLIPSDANETFSRAGGPGFGRRGGFGRGPDVDGTNRPASVPPADASPASGAKLDPLIAANDAAKPLISKLLAVPSLRQRYLGYVREIADKWLDWKTLGPIAEKHHALIAADVKRDTRKLSSYEAFEQSLTGSAPTEQGPGERGPGRAPLSLKAFADERRAFLLEKTK
jgi:hypothetical protein